MRIDMHRPIVRHVTRGAAVTVGLALGSIAAPAVAAPPTDWEPASSESALHYLLLFFGFPAAIAAAIFLLVYLPSMMARSRSTEPALAFQKDTEWFGGPRKGLDDAAAGAESAEAAEDSTGGAGARW